MAEATTTLERKDDMSTAALDMNTSRVAADERVIPVRRRTIDSVLIGFGILATAVFAVAGGLLIWGHNFSTDYVKKELSSQNISFPTREALTEEGRLDLLPYAGQKVDTGKEAQAYASFINGHLANIADGKTYADMGAVERAAKADVQAAKDAGKDQATIDELQAKASGLTAQRDSLFKGETLRGLLLTAYAWGTVGTIAGIAAIVLLGAAVVMAVLVVLGLIHHHRMPKQA
jgi:hypothetical protein